MNTYRPRLFRFEEIVTAREGSGGIPSPRGKLQPVCWICVRDSKILIYFQKITLLSLNFSDQDVQIPKLKQALQQRGFFALIFEFVIIRSRVGARVKERLLSDHRDSPSQQQEVAKASIP